MYSDKLWRAGKICEVLVLKPCLSANAVIAQQRRQQEQNGEGVLGLSLNTMPQLYHSFFSVEYIIFSRK